MPCKCDGRPLPAMFVDPKASKDRRDRFIAKQFQNLKSILNPEGPYLFYTKADFTKMINFFMTIRRAGAVRIYFASFGDDNDTPDGQVNRFTYIFSVAEVTSNNPLTSKDLGSYFNVLPGQAFTPTGSIVDPALASKWVKNWQTGPLAGITVDDKSQNRDDHNRLSDTKCVIYLLAHLKELVDEIACQGATGVRLYLATYLDDDGNFPKRMATQFEMIDEGGDVIDIDRTCRPKPQKILGFDTGSPCPPAVGCTGGLLP